jgi:hypothetical protein
MLISAIIVTALFSAAPAMATYPGYPNPYLTRNIHCTWFPNSYQGVYGDWFEQGNCYFDQGDLAYFANSRLVLQSDGNLVIFAIDSGRVAWNSGSQGHTGVRMTFQSDGNLVIYTPDGTATWWTGTDNACNRYDYGERKYLAFQADGNMVIYCRPLFGYMYALWATNTWMH